MDLIKPDSAGLIYPYVKTDTRNAVFRIEADLKEEVDFEILTRAVEDLARRFPTFFVNLVRQDELFMLAPAKKSAVVVDEPDNVCTAFDFENEVPMRVAVYGSRIAVETFHMLADGHGALIFMKTLLVHYFNLKGAAIEYDDEILDPKDEPTQQEISDAFLSVYRFGKKKVNRFGLFAYQYRLKDKPRNITLTVLRTPSDELRALAKRYNTTIGVFLTAVYIYSFYLLKKRKSRGKIKISIPVDLRSFFPSKTVRNFSLYTIVGIDPAKGEWNLDRIIEAITEQMKKQLKKEDFTDMVYTNVLSANTLFFNHLPMPMKKLILRFAFDYLGERLFTSTLSNMGSVILPDKLREHIADFRLFLGEAMLHQVNVVTSAYGGFANIIFSSRIENDDLQKTYMSVLCENGLSVERYDRTPGNKDYDHTANKGDYSRN